MAKKNAKSDTLQILVFTFFLCAIFFGVWGAILKVKLKAQKTKTTLAVGHLKKMKADFDNPDIHSRLKDYVARQSLLDAKNSHLSTIIQNVAQSLAPSPVITKGGSKQDEKKGVLHLEYSFQLKDSTLRNHIRFLNELEGTRADIDVKKLRLTRKSTRRGSTGPPPDVWQTDSFVVVTQVEVQK